MAPFTGLRLRAPLQARAGGGRWLSPPAERLAVDVLAVVIGIVGELSQLYNDGSPVRAVPVLLTVAGGLALLTRRQHPLLLLGGMLAVTWVLALLGESPGGVLVCVALFTVADCCPTRSAVLALVAGTAVLVALSVTSVPPPVAVWAVGAVVRGRRQHHEELEARAATERAEQDQRAAIAAYEERAAIARELHDIVAHSVTVMLVGVRGARDVLTTRPDVAADVLSRVESSGEQSIAELRRLLTLLRGDARPVAVASTPLPGIAELPTLVAGFRSAGLNADLETSGVPDQVEGGLSLSVYRIVEEALTNVVRHAQTDHARVRLSADPDRIVVEVTDNGIGPGDKVSSGHGLVGMRERARLLGGELTAGGGPTSGFRVVVSLPVREAR